MATVGDKTHTPYGDGTITEVDTVRGRSTFRVAGADFNIWLDETKVHAFKTATSFEPGREYHLVTREGEHARAMNTSPGVITVIHSSGSQRLSPETVQSALDKGDLRIHEAAANWEDEAYQKHHDQQRNSPEAIRQRKLLEGWGDYGEHMDHPNMHQAD